MRSRAALDAIPDDALGKILPFIVDAPGHGSVMLGPVNKALWGGVSRCRSNVDTVVAVMVAQHGARDAFKHVYYVGDSRARTPRQVVLDGNSPKLIPKLLAVAGLLQDSTGLDAAHSDLVKQAIRTGDESGIDYLLRQPPNLQGRWASCADLVSDVISGGPTEAYCIGTLLPLVPCERLREALQRGRPLTRALRGGRGEVVSYVVARLIAAGHELLARVAHALAVMDSGGTVGAFRAALGCAGHEAADARYRDIAILGDLLENVVQSWVKPLPVHRVAIINSVARIVGPADSPRIARLAIRTGDVEALQAILDHIPLMPPAELHRTDDPDIVRILVDHERRRMQQTLRQMDLWKEEEEDEDVFMEAVHVHWAALDAKGDLFRLANWRFPIWSSIPIKDLPATFREMTRSPSVMHYMRRMMSPQWTGVEDMLVRAAAADMSEFFDIWVSKKMSLHCGVSTKQAWVTALTEGSAAVVRVLARNGHALAPAVMAALKEHAAEADA